MALMIDGTLIDALLKLGILCMICVGFLMVGYIIGVMQPDIHAWEDFEEDEVYEDPTLEAGKMPEPEKRSRDR